MKRQQDTQRIIKKCPKGYKYYTATILSQSRVVVDGESNKMKPCTLIWHLLKAKTHKEAIRLANKIGKSQEVSYKNTDGNMVHVEFVGIMDLVESTFHLEHFDEPWVWSGNMLNPMERKDKLTASDEELMKRLTM